MKRFVCFLLAMILVMAMVPAAAVTANAASKHYTSNNAVDILRGSEMFYEKATNGKVGYNTPTTYPGAKEYLNGISKEDALTLMRNYLKYVVDDKINDFTAANNVDLMQKEHDALAVHIYRTGGNDNGLLETVRIVKTVDSASDRAAMVDAFVKAYAPHSVFSDEALKVTLNVSLAEAAMYLYGDYGYNGSSKLAYARLDTTGDMKADEVVAYVKDDGYALQTQGGTKFLGWYLYDSTKKTITGSPLTKLTKDHNGKLIVAKQATGNNDAADYTINTSTLADLHVYNGSLVKTDVVLKNNTNLKVTLEYMGSDGIKWVYGTGTSTANKEVKGWIKIGKLQDSIGANAKPIATATVNANVLYIYPGATSDGAEKKGELKKNDVVNVYEIKIEKTEYGNKRWGKISVGNIVGWINLASTTVNETKGESGSAEGQTGKIANTDTVNVRSSEGITATNWIASLTAGTKVTVLEMNAERTWARIKWTTPANGYTEGWVYMHYVQLDSAPQGNTSSTPGTVIYTGVVTSNINLNVRQYADVYAPKVSSLRTGTKVNIYETAESRNMKWGRIGDGQWVCLSYVKLTKVENTNSGSTDTEVTTELQGTVTSTTLDILKNYNNNSAKVGSLKKGDVVTILEKNTETTETGSRIWGRISEDGVSGWINLAYVNLKTITSVSGSTSTGTSTGTSTTGVASVVSNCLSVNVRESAGVYSTPLTKLKNGTAITVYEEITYDGAPWARIKWNNGADEGWVCMYYVTKNVTTGTTTNQNGTVAGTSSNAISATGYVNNHYLNVRSGAGLGFAQMGTLAQGTKVTIYEQIVADGLIWGKITYNNAPAYVCMSYITVESASSTGKGVMGTVARCFAKANVRSAPGTNNALVATVNVGSRVEVFETKSHANQLWGRIAQGWICMDYVLLDSELPEGTILDATQPTTEATQATTVPEETINRDNEVLYTISGTTNADLDVRNDASEKSDRVGTVKGNLNINILAIKNNNAEVWGRIDQYATAGWVNLKDVTYSVSGYINTENQAVYADANTDSTVKGNLAINTPVTIKKLILNGETVFGWYEETTTNVAGWIPMGRVSSTMTEVIPTYKSSTDPVGANDVVGTTNAAISAYNTTNGSKVVFKLNSGVTVYIGEIDLEAGIVWGKLRANGVDGWVNLNSVTYTLGATVNADLYIGKDKVTVDGSDETKILGKLIAGEAVRVCELSFDANGNAWGKITGNANAALNGGWIRMTSVNTGAFSIETK